MKSHRLFAIFAMTATCYAADLTGNWMAVMPTPGGERKTYFTLKQDGDKITGTVHSTQFYFKIIESSGNPDGFKLTAAMMDGENQRKMTYEGKLVGDVLHIASRRGPNGPLVDTVAHKVPDGEGAMPARIEPPALRKVPYNGLAKTPPMGWNSWNKFAGRVTDADVRGMADAIVSSGMKDAGYVYVNIDDTWEAGRDAKGEIQTNSKFPDMKALADYVHGKGLKIGIYSSPGPNTCAGFEGSYGHEAQDAKTYAAWGIDYLKYDWCGARNIYKDSEMQAVYQKMGDALRATGRPIVYSLCQYGRNDVWKWGPEVGGNLWRTTGDIRDTWASMEKIGFDQAPLYEWAAPGHWNDPDMLEVGNGGMTTVEYRTHMTLWSILAAPLIAGNDLRSMTPEIKDILMNRDVIAIDQDKAGKQARRMSPSGSQEVWMRPLADGSHAVAVFNRGTEAATVKVKWADLEITPKKATDLWAHKEVSLSGAEYAAEVEGHGVVLMRVRQK